MKKTWIIVLAMVMVMSVLCTACGGSDKGSEAEVSATTAPEATELPSVTAPPADADGDAAQAGLAAEDNSAPEKVDRESWLASLSEQQRMVEEELIGAEVADLYAAIGEPISADYTTSCLVADGQDGILTYDGFLVSTTRFANGTEYVMGTDNK